MNNAATNKANNSKKRIPNSIPEGLGADRAARYVRDNFKHIAEMWSCDHYAQYTDYEAYTDGVGRLYILMSYHSEALRLDPDIMDGSCLEIVLNELDIPSGYGYMEILNMWHAEGLKEFEHHSGPWKRVELPAE